MKKLITALWLLTAAGIGVFAQTTDDYKKNEFYVGYSFQRVDRGFDEGFNGAEFSYVRNVKRYVGIKADVSGAFRNENFTDTFTFNNNTTTYRFESKQAVYNFLGGIQIKDNTSKSRLRPFGHALAGVAVNRSEFTSTTVNGVFPSRFTDTGFSAAVGGGLDVKLTDRFDLRAIQADYNPIRINGYWSNNFRFGIGIIIK